MAQDMQDKNKELHKMTMRTDERIKPIWYILPGLVMVLVVGIMLIYTQSQRKIVVNRVEHITNQMSEYISQNISKEINYAKSSIKLTALSVAQTMSSENLEKPADVILPLIENSPFAGIEYIRPDGMNIMNIGEPFDASDRVYYIEGIKGNTGIWNNFHPKTAKETLMNFYTPLIYEEKIVGVITGYIETTTQLSTFFISTLYGQPIYSMLVDEEGMVVCSTIRTENPTEMSLDSLLDNFTITEDGKRRTANVIRNATEQAASYKSPSGNGRLCVVKIPETEWKIAIFVPAKSFDAIIAEDTRNSIIAIVAISAVLVFYAAYVLWNNVKRRRAIARENAKLEEENRIFNEQNLRAFAEISEIRDIIASANMGTWRIELVDGEEPRMYVDDTMKYLLGITASHLSPEKTYTEWYSRIKPEAVQSVVDSVNRMKQGFFDENTYLWEHPGKGTRYVRCGGTSQEIVGGYSLSGYHYDVDEVVRKEQAQMLKLQQALEDKQEYYSTLDTLSDVFYSMHVIDLKEDWTEEISAGADVSEIVNHKNGAVAMMQEVMAALVVDKDVQAALEFTDLTTLAERMQSRKLISKQLLGKNTGWFLASFIAMNRDDDGKVTRVIYTTRIIDEEKKQEEKLIYKTQTDELTGLLNRRAYEENIYEHNDVPGDENFIYVSLDVNGLKVVNDTKGHMAGDELIIGACKCMKECLAEYGKLYRIGGDEFVAILYCDENKAKNILADFDLAMAGWKGQLIDGLSVSYGWASKNENKDASVRQLGAIAEKRMYEAKSAHYMQNGMDRRGQKDAHKALCELYTKILKIDITNDTYQIVNIDEDEQTKEHGFDESISKWLESFGRSGNVHPDDLEEYLKKTNLDYLKAYFAGNKTSCHIFYRRKMGDTFKQVMMEIIPANDYKEDKQSLFLYVKDIDK